MNADPTGKWERPHRKVGIPPTVARRRAAGQALMWNDAWGEKYHQMIERGALYLERCDLSCKMKTRRERES